MEKTDLVQFQGENISLGALVDKLQTLGRDRKITLDKGRVTWVWLVKQDEGFYLYFYLHRSQTKLAQNDVYECRNILEVEAATNQFVLTIGFERIKPELINIIKSEYAKAEAYFGLAPSYDFNDIGDDDEVQLNYAWPAYFNSRLLTPIFKLSESLAEIKMRIWANVISEYQDSLHNPE